MSIDGFINLGNAVTGLTVATPSVDDGYVPQPISFEDAEKGVTLNSLAAIFGPVQGNWGSLTCFNITDSAGGPLWAGTLRTTITPVSGQLIVIPQGNIALILGTTFSVAPGVVSVNDNLSAFGTTKQTATPLTASANIFTSVVVSGTCILPTLVEGTVKAINTTDNDLTCYPQDNAQIDDNGVNQPVIISAHGNASFTVGEDVTQWTSS